MKYANCSKCGANNNAPSKHTPFHAHSKAWCGHCGGKLAKGAK